jgi:hypothetical protein
VGGSFGVIVIVILRSVCGVHLPVPSFSGIMLSHRILKSFPNAVGRLGWF